ncbi:alpha/beta fold hydrolase [Amycolatopsis pithecellobii]|uniref:Alpha/beta fold hydrolase n=1 Tax=Amycolatopsis pithecellobii TaxID=664692 RepID=A0A6N7ZBR0_9PSEU|nr:alpha/beta fold hydrolase [Amycolatopsis pithecellobii]MTD59148.1 alpha/beta fold hydrolase [Amycolatopsis pithecellobii]
MTLVSIVGPDGGETALTGAIQLRILEDGSTTDHRLGIGEITVAPHTDGPPQHRHAQHDEGFYVVRGTARFTVGEETYDAPAGTLVMVPPGAPHTFANPGAEPAVLLNTFTPDLFVQYFRELRDFATAAGRPADGKEIVKIMSHYHTESATTYADAERVQPADPEITDYQLASGVEIRVEDRGAGRPVFLIHGGAGAGSVAGLAAGLAARGVRVLSPVIPGFDGTSRSGLSNVADLARAFRELLDELDLRDVLVAGNSFGGWIAAQMGVDEQAARDDGEVSRIGGLVLVNAVGITVEGHPITDVSVEPPSRLADLVFHSPEKFRMDPAEQPPSPPAEADPDDVALADYAGNPYMHDPLLRARLEAVRLPVLVAWGESDGIVDLSYGRAYAASFAGDNDEGARFAIIRGAGHLPQLEQAERTTELVLSLDIKA